MSLPIVLEFVLVSNEYATMTAVSKGVEKYGGKFVLVPESGAARDYLNRRKTDGVFIDLEVPGALGLIESIRKGVSNSTVVIFACGRSSKEYTQTLNAGANFLLRKPVSLDSVALHIRIAKDLLVRERRRYFRHPVKPLRHSVAVGFSFELPMGVSIRGKGRVAWINAEGMAGIVAQSFDGKGKEHLEGWLAAREQLDSA